MNFFVNLWKKQMINSLSSFDELISLKTLLNQIIVALKRKNENKRVSLFQRDSKYVDVKNLWLLQKLLLNSSRL